MNACIPGVEPSQTQAYRFFSDPASYPARARPAVTGGDTRKMVPDMTAIDTRRKLGEREPAIVAQRGELILE